MTQATPLTHSNVVGGSTANRRIHCPASYGLEQKAPKSKGSIYAREGTVLHEMVALVLDDRDIELPFIWQQPAKGDEDAWEHTIDEDVWSEKGIPALMMFDDMVDQLEAETDKAFNYMIEQTHPFPDIEGAFGTADVLWRCGDIAGVWDWKFGRGAVSANENMQMMFYYACARAAYPKFFEGAKVIRLDICQPMVDDSAPSTWETDNERIDEFVNDLQNAIALAKTDDAPMKKGAWCQWADCKMVCPLHIGAAAELGAMLNKLDDKREAELASEEPIDWDEYHAKAMELAELAEGWAKHVAAMTQQRLEDGLPVAGYKLVAKRSSGREWTEDDDVVISRLKSRGMKADQYYTKKVVTPPAAEKILKSLGKELPEDLVRAKPSSGYTLAREGSPRPSVRTPAAEAQELGKALRDMAGK